MATKFHGPIFIENPDDIPAEAVPENFVSYTLQHQEALPPVTWKNWFSELNWYSAFVLFVLPVLGLIGAWNTPLRLKTAIWFAVYSFLAAFGTFFSPV